MIVFEIKVPIYSLSVRLESNSQSNFFRIVSTPERGRCSGEASAMQNWNIMCENSGSSFGVNASCDGSDPVAVLMTAVLKIATATASKSICFFCGFFNVNVGSFSGHQEILLVESRTTCARYRVFRLKFLFRRRSQFRLPPRPRPPPPFLPGPTKMKLECGSRKVAGPDLSTLDRRSRQRQSVAGSSGRQLPLRSVH